MDDINGLCVVSQVVELETPSIESECRFCLEEQRGPAIMMFL